MTEVEEELRQVNELLQRSEAYAASRDQLINDIEVKFTDYLKEYHQNVNLEISALNTRLFQSMNEVSEYQAELMVAAKEDEGAVTRIQELERRGAIAESGARRIYEVGMEMQSQYKDEIHELKGMLSNAQDLSVLHRRTVSMLIALHNVYIVMVESCKETSRMSSRNIIINLCCLKHLVHNSP